MAYLTAADGENVNSAIWREDRSTIAGETYEAGVRRTSETAADFGFVVATQAGSTDWDDFAGYLAFFDVGDDEIIVGRRENGEYHDRTEVSMTLPVGEPILATLDFGDSDENTLRFAASGENGEIGAAETDISAFSGGYPGIYRYHAGDNWEIDFFREKGANSAPEPPKSPSEAPNRAEYLLGAAGVCGVESDD